MIPEIHHLVVTKLETNETFDRYKVPFLKDDYFFQFHFDIQHVESAIQYDPSKYTDPENQTINVIQDTTQLEESEIVIPPSPRQQVKDGIPNNEIMCRDGHTLVIRTTSDAPICVSPQTADLLVLRGFATS